MRLSALSGDSVAPDPEIAGLTADSRAVRGGFLFAALPGVNMDGAKFIPQAEAAGAAAVLARPGVSAGVPVVADENPRRRLALMAAAFYGRQPETVAGITGTNGKTSTARFAQQLWTQLGRKAGSLGTLGAEAPGYVHALRHTTPDPVEIHQVLAEMASTGVTHLAMEVSSHGLAQHRADGVRFAAAGFTNITQDHLDYHPTFAEYFAAKLRLFSELLPEGAAAVVNTDGEGAAQVIAALKARGVRTLTVGEAGETLKLTSIAPHAAGLHIEIAAQDEHFALDLPLVGAFQAENALVAAGLTIATGAQARDVLPMLGMLSGVRGRMEHAASVNGAGVFIDYAHTPDAVSTALSAIRPHAAGRVHIVLGAGGDRDRGKRPLMGKAAAQGADVVIVTDDNPRSEDPATIRAAVMAGAKGASGAHVLEIGGRADAIRHAVEGLARGDVLLIAGKGHETGQIVGDRTLPFDDAEEARKAAKASQGEAP